MWHLKYYIIFLGIQLATVTSKHDKFYRKDYTYFFEYDAFYKLHIDSSWKTAFLTCENEESKLFYPSEQDEWKIVEILKEKMAASANITDVLIGVHNQFNVGEFITVDGNSPPLPLGNDLQHVEAGEVCVVMNSGTGAYQKGMCSGRTPTLYVCKKLYNQRCPTNTCPTIDTEYKYAPESQKCYKVNKNAKRWQEAIQTCYMEGGLLAVAEDTARVNVIRRAIDLSPYKPYFIGIRDLFNNGNFYTIQGKNIGDITQQTEHQPDPYNPPDQYNLNEYGQEQITEREQFVPRIPRQLGCGAISSNRIQAASCYDAMPFICEMETKQ